MIVTSRFDQTLWLHTQTTQPDRSRSDAAVQRQRAELCRSLARIRAALRLGDPPTEHSPAGALALTPQLCGSAGLANLVPATAVDVDFRHHVSQVLECSALVIEGARLEPVEGDLDRTRGPDAVPTADSAEEPTPDGVGTHGTGDLLVGDGFAFLEDVREFLAVTTAVAALRTGVPVTTEPQPVSRTSDPAKASPILMRFTAPSNFTVPSKLFFPSDPAPPCMDPRSVAANRR